MDLSTFKICRESGSCGRRWRRRLKRCNASRQTRNPKPETQIPKPEIRNPTPETRHPRPETRNPRPENRDLKPKTRNPRPENQDPKPKTRDPRRAPDWRLGGQGREATQREATRRAEGEAASRQRDLTRARLLTFPLLCWYQPHRSRPRPGTNAARISQLPIPRGAGAGSDAARSHAPCGGRGCLAPARFDQG